MDNIAIVGISCLFPGAHDPILYWQQLIEERDLTSQTTAAELGADPAIFYSPELDQRDKTYYLRGGYIRDFTFDPTGYRVSADFLTNLDELFQWSLHVARAALQDSGNLDQTQTLARCGVIMGNLSFPTASSYQLLSPLYGRSLAQSVGELLEHPEIQLNSRSNVGTLPFVNVLASGYPTALMAKALGLGGVHFSLDAACASSLYAVKLACDYLLSGKADLMLAGGVSRADHLFLSAGFSTFHAYPQDGQSCPLDRTSGGLTTGEGAGMVALKRHADAVRDGDHIYAVVRGVGLANDGRGKHLLTPNNRGQVLTLERAYQDAGVDPATVDYVECHATGTPVGDVTEVNSMATFFGPHNHIPRIGSAKANLGHLLTAAGMAGLLKTVLGLNRGQIPATIHVTDPVSSDDGLLSPDHVVRETVEWPTNGAEQPRRAGVSAFGFGGTNAHVVLEQNTPAAREQATAQGPTEVAAPAPQLAIVGMDAFFGNSRGLSAFERTIYDGTQHFIPLPAARWKGIDAQSDLLQEYGLPKGAPQGAYIDQLEFDSLRMRIPPNEAESLNPQQLLMLQVADNALQDAGVAAGSEVAVIVAMAAELSLHTFLERYHLSWRLKEGLTDAGLTMPPAELAELESTVKAAVHHPVETNEYVSVIGSVMANRISSLWDFTGPSFTLSAEENSAFKALEVAQMLLANGELDAVVIGAVDLAGGVENVLLRNGVAPVNTGNPSLSYEADSNGWLVGEGAGALVLKRYADAEKNGDRIYAAVDAVAVVQSTAAGSGSTVSSDTVQQSSQQALRAAKIDAADVAYLELCGSGMPWEDEAELAGLIAGYGAGEPLSCAVGSAKANIGHTFAASGMAGLIKTALCLYHRFIPATPGWNAPADAERWQNSSFYIPTESAPWRLAAGATARRAAVSGLGMDGASAHVLLSRTEQFEEHPNTYLATMPLQLFQVTGNSQAELLTQLDALQQATQSGRSLHAVAQEWHAQAKQNADAEFAVSIVGRTTKQLRQEIERASTGVPGAFAEGSDWKTPRGSYFTANPQGLTGRVAFVYPGAFTSYIGLERGLLHMFPSIYSRRKSLSKDFSFGLDHYLYARSIKRLDIEEQEQLEARFINDAPAMLKAGTITSVGYTTILRDCFHLHPDAAFGYSLGEFSMQFALRVWTSVDAVSTALHNSPLFTTRLSGPKNAVREFFDMPLMEGKVEAADSDALWSTYVLLAPEERVREALIEEPGLYVTHINAPGEVVIAGHKEACRRVIKRLGCDSFRAPFTDVLHSEVMRSEYDAFVELFNLPVQHTPDFTLYSAAHYGPMTVDQAHIGPSIAEALCKPLNFPQLIERAYADGVRIFVELGPGSTCSRWINTTLKEVPHSAMSINGRGMNNHTALLKVLAQLFSHRASVDLSALYAEPEAEKRASIIKTVILGEQRIADTIVTEENIKRFRPLVTPLSQEPTEVQVPAAEPVVAQVAGTLHRQDEQQSHASALPETPVTPVAPETSVQSQNPQPKAPEQPAEFAEHMLRAEQLAAHMQRVDQVHKKFLEGRQAALQGLGDLVEVQQSLAQQLLMQPHSASLPAVTPPPELPAQPPISPPATPETSTQRSDVLFDEQDILEFANGRIAPVFGEEYAIIDTYQRRVRLPGPPYLFMSRVTRLDAERGRFEPCSIRTEYNIPHGAWHTTAGQIPSSVAIEASHANMFLASYLGVDFQNRGERIYRALDGHVTFLGPMAREGDTLICDVRIDSFAKSGDTQIFFYTYDCGVREPSGTERPLLTMGGIAGFFTDEELRMAEGMAGKKRLNPKLKPKIEKRHFDPPLRPAHRAFDEGQIAALGAGDVSGCFGAAYQQHGRNPALRLPDPVFRMIDRVLEVDPNGGEWGLGVARAEKDLSLDGWYFQCHFKNDLCMPGTVVGEGCVQMVQFYLLYLGLQTGTHNARFQPIPDLKLIAQSRGQITPQAGTLTYTLEVTEIGLTPHPYVIGTVDVTFEGRVIARCKDLGLQLVEEQA